MSYPKFESFYSSFQEIFYKQTVLPIWVQLWSWIKWSFTNDFSLFRPSVMLYSNVVRVGGGVIVVFPPNNEFFKNEELYWRNVGRCRNMSSVISNLLIDARAPAPNHLHIKTPWLFLPAKLQGYLKRLCTISYNGCYILVQTLCSSLLDVLLLG